VRIGTISYSIYIWQQIVLLRPQHHIPLGIIAKFPFNVICIFLLATCSHYLVEKPMIAAGRRLYKRTAYPYLPVEKADAMVVNS
jgi:peptidoglycan/LPS O-acetylase OafA/YrhL